MLECWNAGWCLVIVDSVEGRGRREDGGAGSREYLDRAMIGWYIRRPRPGHASFAKDRGNVLGWSVLVISARGWPWAFVKKSM